MFDTSRIHPMLDKVQTYLGQWLEDHLKQIRPADWWERCVMDVLVPEQRENVLNDGANNPSGLDLSMQISVFRGNWQSLRRRFHLSPQLYDDAIAVKRIRNKYSHKKSSEDYDSRFEHDMETVRLFLKGLGASDDMIDVGASTRDTESSEAREEMEHAMTFDSIIESARVALPANVRRAPWIGLEHGVVPLDTEQKLNQYLAAYGNMHAEKIRMALDSLDNSEALLAAQVSIVDWGCGQGLATCCFFDWLHNNEIDFARVSRVHLIEPSALALQRAQTNIANYKSEYNGQFEIKAINKFINNIHPEDFDNHEINTTLHLLSNILDIETVDLDFLAQFINNTFTGRQIFCCVGPLNNGASRIMEFASKFGITPEQIEANVRGRLAHSKGTISMLTFVIDVGKASVVRKVEMEPIPQDVHDNVTLQRLLNRYKPSNDVLDRILQFYLMSTELEQLKEPNVESPTPFVMTETEGGLKVSFGDNCTGNTPFTTNCRNFATACTRNADPQRTRWPKDIHFALEVAWDGGVHRLFYATKPISELRQFDYDHDAIAIPLSEFSVNLACADNLELTDDKIAELENVLHSNDVSLASLANQIVATIDSTVQLNTTQVYVSLCEKQAALAQTYAELRQMDAESIRRNPLLEVFLENAELDNTIDAIDPDELISVVPMDEYQRQSIAHALNNRVSVVVGPPGCGKTQLLLNLLANALVRGKKMLVASKNNKAVDNVAERFGRFDDNGCFLRFGSRNYLRETTCPRLAGLLNLSQDQDYDDTAYQSAIETFSQTFARWKDRENLENEKAELCDEQLIATNQIRELSSKFGVAKKVDIQTVNAVKKQLSKVIADVDYRIAGFSGLWARIIHKKSIVKQALDEITTFPPDILEYLRTIDRRDRVSLFGSCNELLELCHKYCEALDVISEDILAYKTNQEKLEQIARRIEEIKKELDNAKEAMVSALSIENGKQLTQLALNHYLHADGAARAISAYSAYLPESIPWRREEIQDFIAVTKRFLDVCRVVAVTSLSVKNAFPRTDGLFDLLVIDEASQCDIASALPLILRAKQIVIIGDPMQLRHISKIEAEEELAIKRHLNLSGAAHLKYSEVSLWDYAREWLPWCGNDKPSVLEKHYRCHPDIIGYSNKMFYKTLSIGGLDVCTPRFNGNSQGIVWVDVQGSQTSNTVNRNEVEARKAVAIAMQYASEFTTATIGIVTPFKAQAERINTMIPAEIRDRTIVDTVHKFQGDEKDIMIYSLVVTSNSPESKIRWIDYKVPNLVNVAVTRAKRLLVIVGNRNYIRTHSRRDLALGCLESYVGSIERRNGYVQM